MLRLPKRVRCRVIAAHVGKYPVNLKCRVFNVSCSGPGCWRLNPEGRRAKENKQLLARIDEVFLESSRTYGSPRVYMELKRRVTAMKTPYWRASSTR